MAQSPTQHPTLLSAFEHWERKQPDAVYFTQPHPDGRVEDFTWKQVGQEARSIAAYLRTLNLPPQSNIALLGMNSAHWIMADLAIWMAGHVTVPLYPTLNTETAAYIFDHSEAKLLFLGKMGGKSDGWKDIEKAVPASLPVVSLPMSPRKDGVQWQDLLAKHAPLKDIAQPQPSDLVTIVYTSGSTGRPKGVMHSYGSMVQVAKTVAQVRPLEPTDRMLSYLPLAHAAERAVVESTSLYFGFRVFFHNDLTTFVADLKRARPTLFFSVPRLWTKFQQGINQKLTPARQKFLFKLPIAGRVVKKRILRQLGLDQVHSAITGSAPLPTEIVAWYRALGLELLDCYGMSEDFGISHASRPGEVRVGYVGTPAPGVTRRIVDSGEIQIKSPARMLGYYKQPELSAEAFTPDGYFKTGDRGEVDVQGRLRITGRVKELFKCSKGKYIAPVPIENKLGAHPQIEAVCVTGPNQPQPFALLMLSLDAQKELRSSGAREAITRQFAALLDQVNATLEEHEHMDYLVVVKDQWSMDNGFLTPTMKIKRSVIEERYLANAEHWLRQKQKVVWE